VSIRIMRRESGSILDKRLGCRLLDAKMPSGIWGLMFKYNIGSKIEKRLVDMTLLSKS
jgi:hypothetical protein